MEFRDFIEAKVPYKVPYNQQRYMGTYPYAKSRGRIKTPDGWPDLPPWANLPAHIGTNINAAASKIMANNLGQLSEPTLEPSEHMRKDKGLLNWLNKLLGQNGITIYESPDRQGVFFVVEFEQKKIDEVGEKAYCLDVLQRAKQHILEQYQNALKSSKSQEDAKWLNNFFKNLKWDKWSPPQHVVQDGENFGVFVPFHKPQPKR